MDFENINVLHQLRCGGVLEAVRISCAGFPTKIPFIDFVDHFWNLVPELLSRADLDDGGLARAIVAKAKLTQHQAGTTKVHAWAISVVLSCLRMKSCVSLPIPHREMKATIKPEVSDATATHRSTDYLAASVI